MLRRFMIATFACASACSLSDLDIYSRDFGKQPHSDAGVAEQDGSAPARTCDATTTFCALDVAAGERFSCAVATSGKVLCWGSNEAGQFGRGFTGAGSPSPVTIEGTFPSIGPDRAKGTQAIGVDANQFYACAWTGAGDTSCWGAEDSGRLGRGSAPLLSDPLLPKSVLLESGAVLDDAQALRLGRRHACAERASGLACWGYNEFGQIGQARPPDTYARAVAVPFPGTVSNVSAGANDTCAVLEDGRVFCVGAGGAGQLGSAQADSSRPIEVPLGKPAQKVAVGEELACAVLRDGTVACWGTSPWIAPGSLSPTPRAIAGIANAIDLACGSEVLCAISEEGRLFCTGANTFGQLGRGTTGGDTPPAQAMPLEAVLGLDDIKRVSIGADHVCAVSHSGSVFCWGSNASGQLGDGTKEQRTSPVRVLPPH